MLYIVLWRVVVFEADDDALLFAPRAECDDSCSHFVYFLREAQIERAWAAE